MADRVRPHSRCSSGSRRVARSRRSSKQLGRARRDAIGRLTELVREFPAGTNSKRSWRFSIDCCKRKVRESIRNPAGYLVKSIREGYVPPLSMAKRKPVTKVAKPSAAPSAEHVADPAQQAIETYLATLNLQELDSAGKRINRCRRTNSRGRLSPLAVGRRTDLRSVSSDGSGAWCEATAVFNATDRKMPLNRSPSFSLPSVIKPCYRSTQRDDRIGLSTVDDRKTL